MENNNIFRFATKELSQDAFICWCINWINYKDARLYDLAVDVLHLLGQDSFEGLEIKQQYKKTDILLISQSEDKAVIIEDKVFSSEHGEQIKKYKKVVENSAKDLGLSNPTVKTVYFKTGFFYDADELLRYREDVDVVVDGPSFLKVISKYQGESEILDSYVEHLTELINWYDEYGDFRKKYGKNEDEENDGGEWYVKWETIAQYNLMRAFFPKERWNKNTREFFVKSGSSSGRPWTEAIVLPERCFKDSDDEKFMVFWRIDSDSNGPYISLRFYENMDKNNGKVVDRHKSVYKKMRDLVEHIIVNGDGMLPWVEIREGDRGSYKESSLLKVSLSKYLMDWENQGDKLIEEINRITNEFIKGVTSIDV